MKQISTDSYFIRVINTDIYLHDDPKSPGDFEKKEGYENAHIWKKTIAQRLVRAWKKEGITNLELVAVTKAMNDE